MADSKQPNLIDALSADFGADTNAVARVPGLLYAPNFLDAGQQSQLLARVDAMPWMTDLRRRVQHYGYRYDYKSRSVDQSMQLGELPDWAAAVADQLVRRGHANRAPDQLIVNEYEPGQGISNHVDCEPCFDDTVTSISLGSACVMNFTERATGEVVPVLLEPGSAVTMTGASRYDWTHGIPARKSDTFDGQPVRRGRRVSLTFRKVILRNASI